MPSPRAQQPSDPAERPSRDPCSSCGDPPSQYASVQRAALDAKITELRRQGWDVVARRERDRALMERDVASDEVARLAEALDALVGHHDGMLAVWVCDRCGQPLGQDGRCNSGAHVGPGDADDGPASGEAVATTDLVAERDAARADVDTLLEAIESLRLVLGTAGEWLAWLFEAANTIRERRA